jgi:archaellum component FlaC
MKIYRITNNIIKMAVADGEFRDLKDKVNSVKEDIKNLKKEDKDIDSRLKKVEKTLEELNLGVRRFSQDRTVFNSLQRKLERLESVEQQWKKYKEELDGDIKKKIEQRTRAMVTTFVPAK